MLLKRGLQNNVDPSTMYTEITDIEEFFRNFVTTPGAGGLAAAKRLSAVSAAHRIYTNSLAVLPWMVRQKKGEERLAPDHYLDYYLKVRPTPWYSPYMVWKIQASQAFWHGTGYIWIGRGPDGRVSDLFPLLTDGHERKKDPVTGQIWHIFSIPADYPGGKPKSFRCQESQLLIHHFESFTGLSGVGILDLAKESIATDLAAQTYGKKFYTNGARVSGYLEVPSNMKSVNREKVRDDFEKLASGPDNAFRTAVLDLGMKYTQLGINQKDSQYVESRGFSVEEMARFTGIPAYMMQTGKQSYQSNEQQQLDFVINSLTPPVTQQEQEATFKLLSLNEIGQGFYLKRNLAARLRGDDVTRSKFYQTMIGISAKSPDEVRAMEEDGPLPDGQGKKFYMSKNFDVVENFSAGKGKK